MCTCSSCEYTNGLKAWPVGGEAKGPAKSRREYSEHVSHGKRWGDWFNPSTERFEPRIREVPDFTIRPEPVFPVTGTRGCGPVQSMPAWWHEWNARNASALKSKGPDEPAPARPEHPGKDAQHLPELNRQPEPRAILYVMKHGKSQYMTVSQAAEALECSPARILQWIHADRLPGAIKPARDWLIPASAKRPEELPRGRPKAQASR